MDKSPTFTEALRFALHETQADRAIILHEGVAESFGFANLAHFWTEGELSLGMLEEFVKVGKPTLIKDSLMDPNFGERLSTVLSGLGSVMFIPIHNPEGLVRGFFYLDQKGKTTFLSPGHFERVQRYVKETIEPGLYPKKTDLSWQEVTSVRWLNLVDRQPKELG